MPGGYGLGAHHLPSAYAILGRGGSAPGFGGHTPASAPPPPPYSHSSLGTLSVAASQAASLGIIISPVAHYYPLDFERACNYYLRDFEFLIGIQASIPRVQHGGRWPHT